MNPKGKKSDESKEAESAKAGDMFADVESDLKKLKESESVRLKEDISRKLERAKHRLNKLEMLLEITRGLNSTLNLNELLEKIIDSVIKLTDTERGFLMLADREGELQFRIARNREENSLNERDFEVSTSIINDVSRTGEPLFISDVLENSRFKDQNSILDLNLRTTVCMPLTLDGRVIGVIYADSSRISPEFTKDDMSIVSAFAAQATVAFENAKLHGELILSKESLARENLELKQKLSEKYKFSGIIGKSKPLLDIFDTIRKIAPLSTTVLIQGETGTGKELIAKAIHFNGPRKNKKLVVINCGAIPKELMESELFGHIKGSFTGASSDKAGLFETANEGTIFLDEIAEMPLTLQVKLLRALQEGEIRRVGDNLPKKVDVRIIAATNKELAEEVKAGRFRHDLFYRLNVVPINIPPLRERKEDILLLVDYFMSKYTSKMKKGALTVTPETMKLLLTYLWPGNVRELENTIERAIALCGDSKLLSAKHFPILELEKGILGQLNKGKSLKEKCQAVEKQIIIEALKETNGKITKAAELLEVSRQHLHNKIKKYNISNH